MWARREHGRKAKRLQLLQDNGLLLQGVPEGGLVYTQGCSQSSRGEVLIIATRGGCSSLAYGFMQHWWREARVFRV